MAEILHMTNRAKKSSRDSLETLMGRRHSIVYMNAERNLLRDEKVKYNTRVLTVPLPMPLEQLQEQCNNHNRL